MSVCKKKKPTVIDLFAGAGGFSLAAKFAGYRLLAAVEIDKWAQETYRKNIVKNTHPHPKLYGDILDIDPIDIMADINLKTGELDLLIGGPPCQGFSSHRLNNASYVDDPRNQLLLRYFDFVKQLRPKVFVVENVSGILWKRHKAYVDRFKNLTRRNGYKIVSGEPQIINARDFGVPQNRKRVFILGVRSDISVSHNFIWPPQPTHIDSSKSGTVASRKKYWRNARTVFTQEIGDDDPNNVHMEPSDIMIERFRQTPANGGGRDSWDSPLECHKEHQGHKDVYGRINPNKPGPTMTTGCINPSKGRFVHPTKHHGITARHAARFQTFPENFIFYGGLGQAGKQIGNAVPVKLGTHILRKLAEEILQ